MAPPDQHIRQELKIGWAVIHYQDSARRFTGHIRIHSLSSIQGTRLGPRSFRIQRSRHIQKHLFCVKRAKIQKQIFTINRTPLSLPYVTTSVQPIREAGPGQEHTTTINAVP